MYILRVFHLVLSFLYVSTIYAQSYELDTILVVAHKPSAFDVSKSKLSVSRNNILSSDLRDYLQQVSSGVVQQSSPGGLLTFLHKGLPARHFPILWGDFNLLSSTNGVYDLQLIPSLLMNDISLYDFGSVNTLGSQAVSGGLVISNLAKPGAKIDAFVEISSLQNLEVGIKFAKNTSKLANHQFGISYGNRNNIFKYTQGNEKKWRSPTHFSIGNLLYSYRQLFGNRSALTANFWLNIADRDILSSVISNPSRQEQVDMNIRANISYQYFTQKHIYKLTQTIGFEKLDYRAPSIDSRSFVKTIQTAAEIIEKSNRAFVLGLRHRIDIASPNFYITTKSRNLVQLQGTKSWKWKDQRILLCNISQDVVNNQLLPTAASVQLRMKTMELKVAKTYQLPSLNDLYWPQGGNPTLKTETSYQGEIRYATMYKNLTFSISAYSNHVQNWIQWLPTPSGIWSPTNIQNVWSRGIEGSINGTKIIGKSAWEFGTNFHLSRAEIRKDQAPLDRGKQLIYIPTLKSMTNIGYTKGNHKVFSTLTLIGKRYDTSDNRTSLPSYLIVDCAYRWLHKAGTWQIRLTNITNTKFETIRYFPLPGIQGSILYKYTFI